MTMFQLKSAVQTFLPKRALDRALIQRAALPLRGAESVECDSSALLNGFDANQLREVFRSPELEREWKDIRPKLEGLSITTSAGGVNPGDRRAIYYLIRYFRPQSMLEIGTHIGASTVHIAAALLDTARQDSSAPGSMTSVDILDVNDPAQKVWQRFGAAASPKSLTDRIGAEQIVSYVTQPSLDFLQTSLQRFDFCFLDGDHAAKTVYSELAAAMRVLNPGGVILLHDYYPEQKRIWNDSPILPGPWLATQRLVSEGGRFKILPLGELPWPTKLGSRFTSLALVVGI